MLSASELLSNKLVKTFKEAASCLEFEVFETMARLPTALLPQKAWLLAALPPERLFENLKWRQIEGSHYGAAVLELDIRPGFFCRGTTEAFTQYTADKALEAVVRKAKAQKPGAAR